jgi:hypothetical protein
MNNFVLFVVLNVLYIVVTYPMIKEYAISHREEEVGQILTSFFGWVAFGLLITLTSAYFLLYV